MDLTNPTVIIIAVVVILILGALLATAMNRARRTRRLRERFGPEYDRMVDVVGDTRKAEEQLEARLDRIQNLDIRSLNAEEVNRFALEWQTTQAEFVDQPLASVQKANRLIREVMAARGYPVEDFEQRAADISVDYPDLVSNYRELHDIAAKSDREKISTEEMRQAMLAGRALFENLVQPQARAEDTREKEKI